MSSWLRVKCTCGSELTQSRSGSFIGKCKKCDKKFILGSVYWKNN